MRALIQRVRRASVSVGGEPVSSIAQGLLVFVGVEREDTPREADLLARRCRALRLFSDSSGKMNRSVEEIGGAVLVVSQFTLVAETRKGRRPSFHRAAPPEQAERLCRRFAEALRTSGLEVREGRFGAMMDVELVNEGPVTFLLECRGGSGHD